MEELHPDAVLVMRAMAMQTVIYALRTIEVVAEIADGTTPPPRWMFRS